MNFEAHAQSQNGLSFVIATSFVGAVCMLVGLFMNEPGLVIITLISFAIALYNYPFIVGKQPQLIVGRDGLTLDGLGRIRWQVIESLQIETDEITKKPTAIQCHLLPEMESRIIEEEDGHLLRSLQVRIWKRSGPDRISIDLKALKEAPQDVVDAIDQSRREALNT